MEKIITGKHLELREETKQFVMDELAKLESAYAKLTSARVVLEHQRTTFTAEVILRGKHIDIEADAKADNLIAAIDEAMDRTYVQLRKHLDRLHDHSHKKSMVELEDAAEVVADLEPEM